MTPYTDTQLKQTLARMLPEKIHNRYGSSLYYGTYEQPDLQDDGCIIPVLDTELLHLCWLVEESLGITVHEYHTELIHVMPNGAGVHVMSYHATWQQKVKALAAVKCIEICS